MADDTSLAYRPGFRPDIEGLRAVAILLVVAAHAGVPGLAGGFVGVDVFFVLSGYLITGLIINEIRDTGRVDLLRFYARRLRRLLPAMLTMILGVAALAAVLLPPFEQAPQADTARAAAFWLSNIHFAMFHLEYFGPDVGSNLFLHTWSLGVEEQFYLVWPVLLMVLLGSWHWLGATHNYRRLVGGMVATILLCLPLSVYFSYTFTAWGFYLMPPRAWQFALGAVAVLWGSVRLRTDGGVPSRPGLQRIVAGGGWAGLAAIIAAAVWLDETARYPGWLAVIPSFGTAVVLVAGATASRSGAALLLSTPPLQHIGRWSYAWYLWHWPLLVLGGPLVHGSEPLFRCALLAVSLVLALASYRFVERPVRSQAILLSRPALAVAGGVALMLVTVGLAVGWKNLARGWSELPQQKRYAEIRNDFPSFYALGCDQWFYSARVVTCGFGERDATHTAVLMGDSILGQWFPALAELYTTAGWRLIVLTKSSCPMVDQSYFYGRIKRPYVECDAWRKDALLSLASFKPDIVFIGSGLNYPFDKSQWEEGTKRILQPIAVAARRILIVRATHPLSFDGPHCLAGRDWRAALPLARPDCKAPAGSIAETEVLGWLQQAASAFGNVGVLDLNPLVCPQGQCVAERDGRIVYRDDTHLSAAFVASLADAIQVRIAASEENLTVSVNPERSAHDRVK